MRTNTNWSTLYSAQILSCIPVSEPLASVIYLCAELCDYFFISVGMWASVVSEGLEKTVTLLRAHGTNFTVKARSHCLDIVFMVFRFL